MHDRRIHFMREALRLADAAAQVGEVPIGAVVVRGDEIVGRGHNLRESNQDPTAHAEIFALREAAGRIGSWRLEGCSVFVTLEPCAMCAGAMVLARIESCIFGCTDPKGGFLGTFGDLAHWPGLNHHFDVVAGVEEADCRGRLQAFFRTLRADKTSPT